MMAVDTSALMAVVLNEHRAAACATALRLDPKRLISSVTLAEALVVANGRNVSIDMTEFLDVLGCEVVTASAETARRVSQIYQTWGKRPTSRPAEFWRLLCLRHGAYS